MRYLLLAALVASAAPALAAPSWTVNKSRSTLGFTGTVNGQAFNGRFARWDSRIRFDPKDLAGSSVQVVVDTASAATGDKTRDESLPTTDWFSAAAFPRASFEAHSFRSLGSDRYQAVGTLTIRGVKRPVTLAFRLVRQGNHARVVGGVTLDRHAFGIGQGQFSTASMVAFAVQVRFDLDATAF